MLRKAMEVLGLFSTSRPELSVHDVVELLDRPKSTVARWLAAMEETDFLDRDPSTGRYRLSLRLAALGQTARQTTSLQRAARPILEGLAAQTGETANLTVLTGLEAINIEVADSPRPVMHMGWIGRRLPVHATAAGRALLAHAPRTLLDAVLAQPLAALTPLTITDPGELREELARIRVLGYAPVWGELEPDLAAVAAPVRDHTGAVVASIAIGGPVTRCTRESLPALGAAVMDAAARLSRAMGYLPARSPNPVNVRPA